MVSELVRSGFRVSENELCVEFFEGSRGLVAAKSARTILQLPQRRKTKTYDVTRRFEGRWDERRERSRQGTKEGIELMYLSPLLGWMYGRRKNATSTKKKVEKLPLTLAQPRPLKGKDLFNHADTPKQRGPRGRTWFLLPNSKTAAHMGGNR